LIFAGGSKHGAGGFEAPALKPESFTERGNKSFLSPNLPLLYRCEQTRGGGQPRKLLSHEGLHDRASGSKRLLATEQKRNPALADADERWVDNARERGVKRPPRGEKVQTWAMS